MRILILTALLTTLTGCSLIDWGTKVEIEGPGEIAYVLTGQPIPPGSAMGPLSVAYYTASDKTVSLDKTAEAFGFHSGSDSTVVGAAKQAEYQMIAQLNTAWITTLGQLAQTAAALYAGGSSPQAAPPAPVAPAPAVAAEEPVAEPETAPEPPVKTMAEMIQEAVEKALAEREAPAPTAEPEGETDG